MKAKLLALRKESFQLLPYFGKEFDI